MLPSDQAAGLSRMLLPPPSPRASMEKSNFIQILEEHPVNQNTAGCQRSLSRTVLSHTVALSILLLHSLDRDINKKRKGAITVTKALTAQGKWHVNSSSGQPAGSWSWLVITMLPALCSSRRSKPSSPLRGFVCCGAGCVFLCSDTHPGAEAQQPRAPLLIVQAIKRPPPGCFVSDLKLPK